MNFLRFHIVKSDLKTTFEENIMLALTRYCKFPNYQEYWSSENCSFKGCRFRVTKLLLLNIKLLKHWIMVYNCHKRKRQGPREWQLPLPSSKEKKCNTKNLGTSVCQIFSEGGFLVVNVLVTLLFPKLLEWPISPLCR